METRPIDPYVGRGQAQVHLAPSQDAKGALHVAITCFYCCSDDRNCPVHPGWRDHRAVVDLADRSGNSGGRIISGAQSGLRELSNLQRSFSELKDPTEPLANGAMILFAGALLLTPGFFTDVGGLALLVPSVRRAAFLWARARVKVQSFTVQGQQPQQPPAGDQVIDGDFEEVTPPKKPTHRPSGWTQH